MAQSPLCGYKSLLCMKDFLKWLGRFTLPGILFNNTKFAINKLFGTDYSNTWDDIHNSLDKAISGSFGDSVVDNLIGSLSGKYAGTNLTGAEREQNAYTAMREDSRFQRGVVDMQAAGLNPALMYGSSAASPSVNSSAGGVAGSGSLADFLQLAMLPLQMQAAQADIKKTEVDTKATEVQTEGVELDNAFKDATLVYRTEAAEIANNLSRSQISKINAQLDEIDANIRKMSEEAQTEESKRELNFASALLSKVNAKVAVELLPYSQALSEAQTVAQKNYASLLAVQKMYQMKLVNSGYVDAICEQMRSSAVSAEAKAAVDKINSDIRAGKFGNDGSFLGKVGSSLLQGTVLALDQLRGIFSVGLHFGKSLDKSGKKSDINPGFNYDPFGYLAGE